MGPSYAQGFVREPGPDRPNLRQRVQLKNVSTASASCSNYNLRPACLDELNVAWPARCPDGPGAGFDPKITVGQHLVLNPRSTLERIVVGTSTTASKKSPRHSTCGTATMMREVTRTGAASDRRQPLSKPANYGLRLLAST